MSWYIEMVDELIWNEIDMFVMVSDEVCVVLCEMEFFEIFIVLLMFVLFGGDLEEWVGVFRLFGGAGALSVSFFCVDEFNC